MNRDEARAYAKEHGIAGHWDMKANELRAAVEAHQVAAVLPDTRRTRSKLARKTRQAARTSILQAVNRFKILRVNRMHPSYAQVLEDDDAARIGWYNGGRTYLAHQTTPLGMRHIQQAVNIARRFDLVSGELLTAAGFRG